MVYLCTIYYQLWLLLCAGFLVSRADPSADQIKLAKQYAPQLRFHPDEIYFPLKIEDYLSGPVQLLDGQGNVVLASANTQNLDDVPNQGEGTFLTTDISSGKTGFLRGKNPSTTPSKIYTFVVTRPDDVVDLYYWLFTPFNYGKVVDILGIDRTFGDHVSDWEYMLVRTEKGKATQVEYHAHSNSGSGITPWDKAPKFDKDTRPVAYIANGSHGFWSSAGTFQYIKIGDFDLEDITADGGATWDVQNDLEVIKFPDTYDGSNGWLNFRGDWGNQGDKNCGILCEVVDGVPGPNRSDLYNANGTVVNSSQPTFASTYSFKHALNAILVSSLGSIFAAIL